MYTPPFLWNSARTQAYELFLLQMLLPTFLRKWKQYKLKMDLVKHIQVGRASSIIASPLLPTEREEA